MCIVRSFVSSSNVSGGIIVFLCFILYDVTGAVLYYNNFITKRLAYNASKTENIIKTENW